MTAVYAGLLIGIGIAIGGAPGMTVLVVAAVVAVGRE